MLFATSAKIHRKAEISRDTCRVLLEQLAQLPGQETVAVDIIPGGPTLRRDLCSLLNEQVKTTEFLERWATLAEVLVNEADSPHNTATSD